LVLRLLSLVGNSFIKVCGRTCTSHDEFVMGSAGLSWEVVRVSNPSMQEVIQPARASGLLFPRPKRLASP